MDEATIDIEGRRKSCYQGYCKRYDLEIRNKTLRVEGMVQNLQFRRARNVLLLLLFAIFSAEAFQGFHPPCFSSRRESSVGTSASTITRTVTTRMSTRKLDPCFHQNCCKQRSPRFSDSSFPLFSTAGTELNDDKSDENCTENPTISFQKSRVDQFLSSFTLWTPLWTILASGFAVWKASVCSRTVGSMPVMQTAYWTLMLTMGLAISKDDIEGLRKTSPSVIAWNALLCFGAMPLLALGIAKAMSYPSHVATGLVVLGSVGGGQASNLFSLLAGGNVALSVLCTISTTLLGVAATPILLQTLLGGTSVAAGSAASVLKSILSLVLFPIAVGSSISKTFPKTLQGCSKYLPLLGVTSTLLLVAGGSSNSFLASETFSWSAQVLPSCLLAIAGAGMALGVGNRMQMEERTKRTLVVETLSKSPTLAYLLSLRHFGPQAALVPGGAMVTLAVLGALVASIWSRISVGERS